MPYCSDCGSKVYGGACINCCEEIYIYEQDQQNDEQTAFTPEFMEKVKEQSSIRTKNNKPLHRIKEMIMNSKEFRKELHKIMPGYKWTVHRSTSDNYLTATGIQTSGFARMSTLYVTKVTEEMKRYYRVRSSGYGKKAPWLSEYIDKTLARALRGLQEYYEIMANEYRKHANDLQVGRAEKI